MFSNIGIPGLILIFVIALIIFGPSKLPEIGRAAGRTLLEFKSAAKHWSQMKSRTSRRLRKTKRQAES